MYKGKPEEDAVPAGDSLDTDPRGVSDATHLTGVAALRTQSSVVVVSAVHHYCPLAGMLTQNSVLQTFGSGLSENDCPAEGAFDAVRARFLLT